MPPTRSVVVDFILKAIGIMGKEVELQLTV